MKFERCRPPFVHHLRRGHRYDSRRAGGVPLQHFEGDQAEFERWADDEFTKVVDEVLRSRNAGEKHVNVANRSRRSGSRRHPTEPVPEFGTSRWFTSFGGPLPGLGGAPWNATPGMVH